MSDQQQTEQTAEQQPAAEQTAEQTAQPAAEVESKSSRRRKAAMTQPELPQAMPEPEAKPAPPEPPKVVEGLYNAKGGGFDLHVEAETREVAVELVKAYTGLDEQGFVVTQCKARPAHGTPTLRGGYQTIDVDGKQVKRLTYERG